MRINKHKRNNAKKHSTNNTKHSKCKHTYYQNTHTMVRTPTDYKTHTYTHPQITKPKHTHNHKLQKLPRSYRIQVCKKVDNRHCQQPIDNASNMTTDSAHAIRSRPVSVSVVCCRNMPEDKDVSGKMCLWRTPTIKKVSTEYLLILSVYKSVYSSTGITK